MRKLILAAAGLAALIPVTGASAQYYGRGYDRGNHYGHYDRDIAREIRECRRELRRADSRREYRRELRECRREIREERRDNRRDWRYDRRSRDRYYRNWKANGGGGLSRRPLLLGPVIRSCGLSRWFREPKSVSSAQQPWLSSSRRRPRPSPFRRVRI